MLHYGPVFYNAAGHRRPPGSSLALCGEMSTMGSANTLTKDKAMVTCEECKRLLDPAIAVRRAAE
jgi:hypothetical protein